MDLNSLNKSELVALCKKLKIKNYSKKNKSDLKIIINKNTIPDGIIPDGTISDGTIPDDTISDGTIPDGIIPDGIIPDGIIPDGIIPDGIIPDGTIPKLIKDDSITTNKLTFIDLFCGIGGFHQALTAINAQCVFSCDIDENCRTIYEKNYGIKPHGDITKIKVEDIPNFDILCGGFPCQPFSKAGSQRGFNDTRGNLFFNICNIIRHHNPKYLLLENVKNLLSHDKGNSWGIIYEHINNLGYFTYETPLILNVLHFNIPQNRERIIIMCKRKDLGDLPIAPIIPKNPKMYLTNTLANIIKIEEKDINDTFKISGKLKDVEIIWNNFIHVLKTNNIEIPKYPIWTDWWDNDISKDIKFYTKYKNWIDKNRLFYETNKEVLFEWITKSRENANWIGAVRKFEWQAGDDIDMNSTLWTARSSGIRVKKIDYIPTLVAMSMIPIYGPESRKLTPKELLRLQSFSEHFKYDEKTILKQIGNSVNVKMIEQCAKFLIFENALL